MALFNNFPYSNTEEINLDYTLNKLNELYSRGENLYAELQSWKTATDEANEAWKSDLLSDINEWQNSVTHSLEEWKNSVDSEVANALTSLSNQITAELAQAKTDLRNEVADLASAAAASASDAVASQSSAAQSAQTAINSAAAARQSEQNISESAEQITTNKNDITDLKSAISPATNNIEWTVGGAGYINYSNGTSGTTSLPTSYTDYVDVSMYGTISYKRIIITAGTTTTGMAFYDDNHTYISGIVSNVYGAETGYKPYTVDVPNNAKYARFTYLSDDTTYGEFTISGKTFTAQTNDALFAERPISLWEQGTIRAGTGYPSNPSLNPEKIRTIKYVGVSTGELSVKTDELYNLLIFAYSEDYSEYYGILHTSGSFTTGTGSIAKVKSYDFSNHPTWRFKIVLERDDQTAINADEGAYCIFNISAIGTINSEINKKPIYWAGEPKPPYCIMLLELARKYISVENIKTLIDTASTAGFNQLMLHISNDTSFRLALSDMIVSANNTTYDLSACLGGLENPDKYYTQDEMDEIIEYAQSKNIDVAPMFEMPGHMGRILSVFPEFKYPDTQILLNIEDTNAINFAKAIADRYSKYFKSRGCHFYNMAFDEIPNIGGGSALGYGYKYLYEHGKFQYVTDFANTISELIKKNGLKPCIFNESVFFMNDYKYQIDTDFEVFYWRYSADKGYSTPTAQQRYGYHLINSNEAYYYVLGRPNITVDIDTLNNANNILRTFPNGAIPQNAYGAVFCIWCDNPNEGHEGDDGAIVVTETTPLIEAFGRAFKRALYSVKRD